MKNLIALTLITSLIIPMDSVFALTCDEAKRSLVQFQTRENEMTMKKPDGTEIKFFQEEIKRDKILAELMLLEGIEDNIKKFHESLKKIKENDDSDLSLYDLLNSPATSLRDEVTLPDGTKSNQLDELIKENITAANRLKAIHILLAPKMETVGNRGVWRNNLRNDHIEYLGLRAALRKANVPETDLNKSNSSLKEMFDTIMADDTKKDALIAAWKDQSNGIGGEELWEDYQKLCKEKALAFVHSSEENNHCKFLEETMQGPNPAAVEETIKGYLGLAKRITINPSLFDEKKEEINGTQSDTSDFHMGLRDAIERRIPEGVIQRNDYQEHMTAFMTNNGDNTDRKGIKDLSKDKLDALQAYAQAKATCKIITNGRCTDAQLKQRGLEEDILTKAKDAKDYAETVQTFIDNYAKIEASDDKGMVPEEIKKAQEGLAKLRDLLNVTNDSSESGKLLSSNLQEKIKATGFKSNETFKQYLADTKCIKELMTKQGVSDVKPMLLDMIKGLGIDKCKGIGGTIEPDQFNDKMNLCLTSLSTKLGREALDAKKKELKKDLESADRNLSNMIKAGGANGAYARLQMLKADAMDEVKSSCENNDGYQTKDPLKCFSQGNDGNTYSQIDLLTVEVDGAVNYINVSNIPKNRQPRSENLRDLNDNIAIQQLCQGEAGGQSIANGNPLCRRANSRIERENDNARVIRRSRSRRSKYYVADVDPDGRKVYARRTPFVAKVGMAAANTGQSWINFFAYKFGQDSLLQANTMNAEYWHGYYSSIGSNPYGAQLATLASPATFQFNQQPTRFRV